MNKLLSVTIATSGLLLLLLALAIAFNYNVSFRITGVPANATFGQEINPSWSIWYKNIDKPLTVIFKMIDTDTGLVVKDKWNGNMQYSYSLSPDRNNVASGRTVIMPNKDWKIKFVVSHLEDSVEVVDNTTDYIIKLTTAKECEAVETKCLDGNYYTCDNYKWVNKGEVVGKCGVAPPTPPKPVPLWRSIITSIIDWLRNLFSYFFTVTGPAIVTPGTLETYNVSLSANIPDSDWSDGKYQVQYASWALVDKDGNIKQEGAWEEILGSYNKQVSIVVPKEIGKYVLVAVIKQYDMDYNFDTNKWDTTKEEIIVKEGIDIQTKTVAPPKPPVPVWSSIVNFFKSAWDWFKGWFGL